MASRVSIDLAFRVATIARGLAATGTSARWPVVRPLHDWPGMKAAIRGLCVAGCLLVASHFGHAATVRTPTIFTGAHIPTLRARAAGRGIVLHDRKIRGRTHQVIFEGDDKQVEALLTHLRGTWQADIHATSWINEHGVLEFNYLGY
jgi:hypothetical protein